MAIQQKATIDAVRKHGWEPHETKDGFVLSVKTINGPLSVRWLRDVNDNKLFPYG